MLRFGSHERSNDGLTQWHPAFLMLVAMLEICAAKYRKFCQKYKPKPKPEKRNYWGTKLLANLKIRGKRRERVAEVRSLCGMSGTSLMRKFVKLLKNL